MGEGGPGVGPPGLPVDGADAVGGPRAGGPARGEAPGGARVWRATARLPGWKTEPPSPQCHQAAHGNSKRPGSRAREPRPARPPGVPLLDPSSAPDVGAGQARSPHAQSWVRGAGGPWPASEAPRSVPARKPRSVGSGGEPWAGALLRAGPLRQCDLPWSWGPILKTWRRLSYSPKVWGFCELGTVPALSRGSGQLPPAPRGRCVPAAAGAARPW